MDKYEYKIRADEIKALIAEGEYAEAVSIADTIDWRRVKSVMMLCTISDLYKINRRYQESKDILLLAYEKHPTGRLIVYSLCELSIKMEEYVQAIEYYKEFVQIAPKDTGRYVLQYRLYEAQDVGLEERIEVLEEFKKRDYREKWAYELAYLYHRIGLTTKCIEECDEMFLWFGEGRYVIKALELKALHEPLNAEQQAKYDVWSRGRDTENRPDEEDDDGGLDDDIQADKAGRTQDRDDEEALGAPTMELPEVKTVDLGQYNTINLQMALAESMKEILDDEKPQETDGSALARDMDDAAKAGQTDDIMEAGDAKAVESESAVETESIETVGLKSAIGAGDIEAIEPGSTVEAGDIEAVEAENAVEAGDIEAVEAESAVETGDIEAVEPKSTVRARDIEAVEPKSTVRARDIETIKPESAVKAGDIGATESESAAGVGDSRATEPGSAAEDEDIEAAADIASAEENFEEPDGDGSEVSIAESLIAPLLEDTARMPAPQEVEDKLQESAVIAFPGKTEEAKEDVKQNKKAVMDTEEQQKTDGQIAHEDAAAFDAQQILEQMKQEAWKAASDINKVPGATTGVLTPLNTKPSKYDNFLSQEYDGQISLVMPEAEYIEKQITGQLSIEDIMAEWEEMKKSNEQKRMEDVRRRILEHTGNLFADFDEATKNGLLEELERAFVAAIMKESGKNPAIKQVIVPEKSAPALAAVKETAEVQKESEEQFVQNEIEDEVEALEDIEEFEKPEDVDELISQTAQESTETPQDTAVAEEETAQQSYEAAEDYGHEEPMQDRELTEEEAELFGQFAHHRKSKRQLVHTLDNMSLASCTGNVIITGEEEITTLTLAKALIREMQYNDNNFSGKVAKISANVLNKKDVEGTLAKLDNGALIIEKAAKLKPATVDKITKVLEKDNRGLLLLMIDKKTNINQLLAENTALNNNFNLRVDIEPLDDEALVAYARQYAEELEYSIDEFGILALHTRIADRQTSDHEVSMSEIRELVDEAIHYANKKTPRHFMDILLAKRYDEEDMIILREQDFMHY